MNIKTCGNFYQHCAQTSVSLKSATNRKLTLETVSRVVIVICALDLMQSVCWCCLPEYI